MAVDEFLYQKATQTSLSYLRFYHWERPTVSLGHSQDSTRVLNVDFCRENGIDIVRRITGGKLVLHDREVTYAIASSDEVLFTGNLGDSYRLITKALIMGLELMGLSPGSAGSTPAEYVKGDMPCFAFPARDEIEAGGRKIVGSAQKRAGALFLQHGSIPLHKDEGLLAEVSAPGTGGRAKPTGMTSISDELGRSIEFDWAVEHLKRGFSRFFDVPLVPEVYSQEDREQIAALCETKYRSPNWTFGRHSSRS
jgi:lipoate-protein ligase A